MCYSFLNAGFAVLRVNLRGANPGRNLAMGSYSANCNSDIIPVLIRAKELSNDIGKEVNGINKNYPLFGAGISLGGTILINTLQTENLFNGLVCTSSPLDLEVCSQSIERARNTIYQTWLVNRLLKQTLHDPFGIEETTSLKTAKSISDKSHKMTIRLFDSIITAPRWGYKNVEEYYKKASPLQIIENQSATMPSTLFLQSDDDPWVPSKTLKNLSKKEHIRNSKKIEIVITKKGGHNGFHGIEGCWGDILVTRYLQTLAHKSL